MEEQQVSPLRDDKAVAPVEVTSHGTSYAAHRSSRQILHDGSATFAGSLAVDQLGVRCGIAFAFNGDCGRGLFKGAHVFRGEVDGSAAQVFFQA